MARYYSATSGSFWSPDPGGMKTADSTDPTSWNRYSYTGGDPINRIDPTGRCWVWGGEVWVWQPCDSDGEGTGSPGPAPDNPGPPDPGPNGGPLDTPERIAKAGAVASAALKSFFTTSFSLDCNNFVSGAIGMDLETIQSDSTRVSVASGLDTNTGWGASLFPGNPGLAQLAQASVDNKYGGTDMTMAQVFDASPTTYAAGQYNGDTIYYNSAFADFGSGYALYTIFHEMLHIEGFSDKQLEAEFGISDVDVKRYGSVSITLKLMQQCGQ